LKLFGLLRLSETAAVTNSLSPTTTGCDKPVPGSFTFQARFLSADHSVGMAAPFVAPDPLGPRNWGQSSAITGVERHRPRPMAEARKNRIIRSPVIRKVKF